MPSYNILGLTMDNSLKDVSKSMQQNQRCNLTRSSSLSKPAAYISHNATRQIQLCYSSSG